MSKTPVETLLLARLDGVRKAPKRPGIDGAWRARCPVCGARDPRLSIAITTGGAPLLHCFGGCGPLDVLSTLGLDWTDLHTRSPGAHAHRGNGGPSTWAAPVSAAEAAQRALERALAASAAPAVGEGDFEDYLKSIFEAAEQIQNFKKFTRDAVRSGSAK